jgi:hypothetical protein
MIDWSSETILIEDAANAKNIDPFFVMAIREAENGAQGKEFGVLSTTAPTYADQLRICVATVAHRLESFPANPVERDSFGRIRYSLKWIAYFQSIWAPVGLDVANDPNRLNLNWLTNVEASYVKFIGGHI